MKQREHWPAVTDPVARGILKALADDTPGVLNAPKLYEEYLKPRPWASRHLEIRRKLEQSGLATSIAKGMSDRPTIYDNLPGLARSLVGPFTPRSPGAMAVHVARNLDWYLSPPARIDWLGSLPYLWQHIGVSWAALFMLFMRNVDQLSEGWLIAGLLLFAAVGLYWLFMAAQGNLPGQGVDNIHKTEFYWYLLDAFSDKPQTTREPARTGEPAPAIPSER